MADHRGHAPKTRVRQRGTARFSKQTRRFIEPRGTNADGSPLASVRAVDCWIGVVQEGDRRLVRLAGRLSAAQVPELLTVCTGTVPLHIDLTDLVSADAAGIEALQLLRGRGATLSGTPGYLQLQLDSPSNGAKAFRGSPTEVAARRIR